MRIGDIVRPGRSCRAFLSEQGPMRRLFSKACRISRHMSAKMAFDEPPAAPTVVILGSTGTGKSELAVELATRFNGEIVNADAMQMYKGLPIITNKISKEEQRGIPHHLLGNIGLDENTWIMPVFKREASRIIREIRDRGKLPIVVGGTHYYTNGLLFEATVVQGPSTPETGGVDQEDAAAAVAARYPILDGSTDAMLQKLREVDPVMASRWHPNDRRKIRRSLEIYLTTGRPASDIYAEQQSQKGAKRSQSDGVPSSSFSPWETLLFWLYSEPDHLNERLNKRVDKMVGNGLLDETAEMYEYLQQRLASGETVDRSTGIWQSIGFRQFEPYLAAAGRSAETVELNRLKQAGIEETKTATRRYAKYQVRWITMKTLPLLQDEQALERLFLLDSTDIGLWGEQVLSKANSLTSQFLAGEQLPQPVDLSETARDILSGKIEASNRQETPCNKTCAVCNTTCLTEELWQRHVSSNRHRKAVRYAKRRALVPVGGHGEIGSKHAVMSEVEQPP